jgi:hypothetical protein
MYWIDRLTIITNGTEQSKASMGSDVELHLSYASNQPVRNPKVLVIFTSEDGHKAFQVSNRFTHHIINEHELQSGILVVRINPLPLCSGVYGITLHVGDIGGVAQVAEDIAHIEIEPRDIFATGRIPHPGNGHVWAHADFKLKYSSNPV